MVKGFCRVVSDIPGRAWNVILAEEDKRFMIYRTEKVQVAALTTSFTLPFPAKLVFERIQELHVENQLLSEHALPLKLFKEYPFGIKMFNYGRLNIHLRFSKSCVLDEDLMSILVYSNDIPAGENLELKTSGFAVQSFGLNVSLLTVHMVHSECEKLEECSYGTLLESLKLAAGKLTQKI
ncbi:unnamed protein product, partial [Arabidopsis halleri]